MNTKTLVLASALVLAPMLTAARSADAQSSGAASTTTVTNMTGAPVERERVRVRVGFSFNGGGGLGAASGPVASASLRLGLQFNRYFSVYYQNSPLVFAAARDTGLALGAMDLNAVIANVTLGDFFDIGLGPSVDYYSIAGCVSDDNGSGCEAASGAGFGMHGRVAINLGGRNPDGGRRAGFSIGLDAHPIFTAGGPLVLTTLGLGAEWF